MSEPRTVIDQALAVIEEAKPLKFGDALPVTVAQTLVLGVYDAVQARDRGHGSDAEVDKAVKLARRGGIPEPEISAAVLAAGANEKPGQTGP